MIQIHTDNLEFFLSRQTKYQNYARKSSKMYLKNVHWLRKQRILSTCIEMQTIYKPIILLLVLCSFCLLLFETNLFSLFLDVDCTEFQISFAYLFMFPICIEYHISCQLNPFQIDLKTIEVIKYELVSDVQSKAALRQYFTNHLIQTRYKQSTAGYPHLKSIWS